MAGLRRPETLPPADSPGGGQQRCPQQMPPQAWDLQRAALPVGLLCAALAVCLAPERSVAVVLTLLALAFTPLGALCLSPHVESAKGVSIEHLIDMLRDKNLEEQVLATTAHGVDSVSKNKELRSMLQSVLKSAVTEAIKDEGFMADMVVTMTSSTLAAARNKELREATLSVMQQAVTDSLKDEGFMSAMLATLIKTTVGASRDLELRDAMQTVTKAAVTDALRDHGFMLAFQRAMCEGLKDSNIYRSAAAGMVSSLNPFHGKQGSSDAAA